MNFHDLLDFVLHIDKHLQLIMADYQTASYAILFLIIFCETGLVAMPFLPGDSLLFAAGALTASNHILDIRVLIPLLILAALLGDNVNYFVGEFIGHKVFELPLLRKIVKREYLDKTHLFYEKHGGKAIIIARFVPIVRTFAPFVAGLGDMTYRRYMTFCVIGAVLWVNLLTLAGYYFGNMDFVKNNFELVILAIIVLSLMPPVIAIIKEKLKPKQ
jgi:membrane-associated protein